jgi:hypothetical protein
MPQTKFHETPTGSSKVGRHNRPSRYACEAFQLPSCVKNTKSERRILQLHNCTERLAHAKKLQGVTTAGDVNETCVDVVGGSPCEEGVAMGTLHVGVAGNHFPSWDSDWSME